MKLYRSIFHYYLFNVKNIKNVLILGTNKRAKDICEVIQNKKALKMNVVGLVGDNIEGNYPKIFNNITDLKNIVKENNIKIIVLTEPNDLIITAPKNVKLYKMTELYEAITDKFYIDKENVCDFYYHFIKNHSLFYDFFKRAFDIISGIIILVVTLPITLTTALVVYFTDKQNPIYTQTRITKNGKKFKCYKLRTMYANSYIPKNLDKGGYSNSQDNDDRVIPFCKFIRKARFDEIPQMINIIKGDMSIVGPRAEWEEVVNIYSKNIPYYSLRTITKTAWTGWAQINQGHLFSLDDEEQKLVRDLYYIKNRNIFWEIGILIKAVFLAIGGRHD